MRMESAGTQVNTLHPETADWHSLRQLFAVVTGQAGTGKSTWAELFFRFLRAYGVLAKDVFISTTGSDLRGDAVGKTGNTFVLGIRS